MTNPNQPDPYHPYQPDPYQPGLPVPPPPPPDPPVQAYQPPPVYYQPYPTYYAPPRSTTEGLAIASLAVSCAAVPGICGYGVGGLLGLVGAIMGHVARRRIRRSGAQGDGMAIAGIIVGWIMFGLTLSAIALIAYLIANEPTAA